MEFQILLLLLPTLERLSLSGFILRDIPPEMKKKPETSLAPLTYLVLDNCTTYPAALAAILSIRPVKYLSLLVTNTTYYDDDDDMFISFSVDDMMKAMSPTADSLHGLSISFFDDFLVMQTSFHNLTNLEYLIADAGLIFGGFVSATSETSVNRMEPQQVLPPNIEALKLVTIRSTLLRQSSPTIRFLVTHRSDVAPRLQKLSMVIIADNEKDAHIANGIREACSTTGLQFEVIEMPRKVPVRDYFSSLR